MTTPALPSETEVVYNMCYTCGYADSTVFDFGNGKSRHLWEADCIRALKRDRGALRARCAQLEGDAVLEDQIERTLSRDIEVFEGYSDHCVMSSDFLIGDVRAFLDRMRNLRATKTTPTSEGA